MDDEAEAAEMARRMAALDETLSGMGGLAALDGPAERGAAEAPPARTPAWQRAFDGEARRALEARARGWSEDRREAEAQWFEFEAAWARRAIELGLGPAHESGTGGAGWSWGWPRCICALQPPLGARQPACHGGRDGGWSHSMLFDHGKIACDLNAKGAGLKSRPRTCMTWVYEFRHDGWADQARLARDSWEGRTGGRVECVAGDPADDFYGAGTTPVRWTVLEAPWLPKSAWRGPSAESAI